MNPWIIYFDGLTEPSNPGGVMAWGWILDAGADGTRTGSEPAPPRPENTNNVAEYLALYHALVATAEWKVKHFGDRKYPGLVIRGDSKLVCEQIGNRWKVNHPRLQKAHAACLGLIHGRLDPFMTEWIPREKNEGADALSREGYRQLTGKLPPMRAGWVKP